jgi:hypothetical protein
VGRGPVAPNGASARPTGPVMVDTAHVDHADVRDLEAAAPDGRAHRVCLRRRGEPLRRWEPAGTAFDPLDLLVLVAALGHRLTTAARVRVQRGWTVGVLEERDLRWRIVHREHLRDEATAERRAGELAHAVERGLVPR